MGGIGSPLYVDMANAIGIDRATLRVAVLSSDPSLLPQSSIVNLDNRWRKCPISLIGWEIIGEVPHGFDGPTGSGQLDDVDWERETPGFRQGRDLPVRSVMLAAGRHLQQLMGSEPHQNHLWGESLGGGSHGWSMRDDDTPSSLKMGPRFATQEDKQLLIRDNGLRSFREGIGSDMHKSLWPLVWNFMWRSGSQKKHKEFTCSGRRMATNNNRENIFWKVLRLNIPDAYQALPPQQAQSVRHTQEVGTRCLAKSKIIWHKTNPQIKPCRVYSTYPKAQNTQAKALAQGPKPIVRKINPSQPSILGPPPPPLLLLSSAKFKNTSYQLVPTSTNCSQPPYPLHYLPYNPKHSPASAIVMASSSKFQPEMGLADEELIKKFAGMQTAEPTAEETVTLPIEAMVCRQWELCLLVRVCTDRLVFDSQFEQQMRRLWNVNPQTVFSQIDKGLFLVELTTPKEVELIQNKGPWFYKNDLLAITTCQSSDQLTMKHVEKGELWVQFHNAPLEAMNEEGFSIIMGPVGLELSDPVVVKTGGKKFFRIKLQVDLGKPLKDKVRVKHPVLGEIMVYVVYERIARVCRFCGEIGHELNGCADRQRLARLKRQLEGQDRPEMKNILNPTRGPWIVNQMLLPTQGEDSQEEHPNSNSSARPKRNIDQIMRDAGNGRLGIHISQEYTADDDSQSGNEDNDGSVLTFKKAKAARPTSPLER